MFGIYYNKNYNKKFQSISTYINIKKAKYKYKEQYHSIINK
jgi:hypothetical protein